MSTEPELSAESLWSRHVLWDRLDEFHNDLRKARGQLLEMLEKNPEEEVRDLRFPIFGFLCDTIYEAAKKWHNYEGDFPFYFWPGYDSIRGTEDSHKRVPLHTRMIDPDETLETDITDGWDVECGISPPYTTWPTGEPMDEISNDISTLLSYREKNLQNWLPKLSNIGDELRFPAIGNQLTTGLFPKPNIHSFRVLANPASLWFSILLRRAERGKGEYSDFVPGGTHAWLSNLTERFRGLIVNRIPVRAPLSSGSFITHNIPSLESAGPDIGKALDQANLFNWPASSSAPNIEDVDLRRELYTPWLTGVFEPDSTKTTKFYEEVEKIVAKSPTRLRYINLRMAKFARSRRFIDKKMPAVRDFIAAWSAYQHWYSLIFDKSIASSSEGVEEHTVTLGSGMFFSARPLHPDFLTVLRIWLEQIYLILRNHENRLATSESSKRRQRYLFAHEAKGKIQNIIFDPNLPTLDRYAQLAVHLLNRDIFLWNAAGTQISRSVNPEKISLYDCSEIARVFAYQHLESKIGSKKALQKNTSPEEEEYLRSRFRNKFNTSGESREKELFSDETVFSKIIAGSITTHWRIVLGAILECALRQSLCHAAICRERLGFKNRTLLPQLHTESIEPQTPNGIIFIITGHCLDNFRPEETTENETLKMLSNLTSKDLEVIWEVVPSSDFFISRLAIHDPTATLLQ